MSTDPQQLSVVGLPCFPRNLALTMTNTQQVGRYADLTLHPSGPLKLSRELFSSYLPAVDPDQPVTAPVEVRVPRDTLPGSYQIDLEVDRTRLTVPVEVKPLPPKGAGSNLALGEQAAASSTHGNFSLCGAVDGDTDSATGMSGSRPAAAPGRPSPRSAVTPSATSPRPSRRRRPMRFASSRSTATAIPTPA